MRPESGQSGWMADGSQNQIPGLLRRRTSLFLSKLRWQASFSLWRQINESDSAIRSRGQTVSVIKSAGCNDVPSDVAVHTSNTAVELMQALYFNLALC